MIHKLIAVLALTAACYAGDCSPYKQAKLVDSTPTKEPQMITNTYNGSSIIVNHRMDYLAVQFEDMTYTFEASEHRAKNLIVGDPVEACVDDKRVYLHTPEGKTIKGRIVKRARVQK